MSKRYLLPLVLALALALVGAACGQDGGGDQAQQPEDGEETTEEPEISGDIKMARANWDTGYFQAEIYYQLLEELGYNVEHPSNNESGAQVFYTALQQGDLDFWANGWFPLHDEFVKDKDDVEKVGTQVDNGAFQGYLVDKATAEENDITSLQQIAESDELKKLFDFQGDDRADLVGCNSGWGCHDTIEKHLKETGMNEDIEHLSAEYSALVADAVGRYERGDPILWYTWTPNWTIAELVPGEDVVWIESPTHPNEQEPVPGDQVPGGPEACVNDPCDIGWQANDIRVVANSNFLDENPAAEALFKEIKLSVDRISQQNKKMDEGEDSREDIEKHAKNWIQENQDKVDKWLQTARDAASGS